MSSLVPLLAGKDKKRAEKATTTSADVASFSSGNRAEELKAALAKIRAEPLPASTQDKEQYFMAQASLGEQLCTQGALYIISYSLTCSNHCNQVLRSLFLPRLRSLGLSVSTHHRSSLSCCTRPRFLPKSLL